MISQVTAFHESTRIASGDLRTVVGHARAVLDRDASARILLFNDATGEFVDIDLHGTPAQIDGQLQFLLATGGAGSSGEGVAAANADTPPARTAGRPRLGVVAREVTLLPRHWDWLSAQPGGASVTLRRLVDQARAGDAGRERTRQSQNAAYRFMLAMAGNQPGFEEAVRALFARDQARFDAAVTPWPTDIRNYARVLAASALEGAI